MDGSPGLVVMGDDSSLRVHGFKSWRRILDGRGIFSHWFVVKSVLFVWKDRKNKKRGGGKPIKKPLIDTKYTYQWVERFVLCHTAIHKPRVKVNACGLITATVLNKSFQYFFSSKTTLHWKHIFPKCTYRARCRRGHMLKANHLQMFVFAWSKLPKSWLNTWNHFQLQKLSFGPLWWSSGQRACHLLQQFKFECCGRLQFFL